MSGIIDSEELWKDFEDYLLSPYDDNPQSLLAVQGWFAELYARKQAGENLNLSFIQATYEVTQQSLQAYCLNSKMFFSHNPCVLRLSSLVPSSDGTMTTGSDSFVGVWLKDFGAHGIPQQKITAMLSDLKGRPTGKLAETDIAISTVVQSNLPSIATQIQNAYESCATGDATQYPLDKASFRFTELRPGTSGFHRDENSYHQPEKDINSTFFCHVVIHPFMGPGTEFKIENQGIGECLITCPPFAVSSHLAVLMNGDNLLENVAGALHRSVGHIDGRGIVIFSDSVPKRRWIPSSSATPEWQINTVLVTASEITLPATHFEYASASDAARPPSHQNADYAAHSGGFSL